MRMNLPERSFLRSALHDMEPAIEAGYTHVIGTLWNVADLVTAKVTRIVYDDMATPAPDAAKTAQALHHAVREIRAEYPDTPALWAAHIHVGP